MHGRWRAIRWPRPEAEIDLFLALVKARPTVLYPYAVLFERAGAPAAMAAGRVEEVRLSTEIGYLRVYEPAVRSLIVPSGSAVSFDDDATEPLIRELAAALQGREADVLTLSGLEVGSPLHREALALGGFFRRQHFTEPRKHWRLILPETFDDFLASRTGKTRFGVRSYGKRLLAGFGDELTIETLAEPKDLDQIFRDIEQVAAKTYQRALRTGFDDTPERRERVRVSLDHRWFRAYLLYRRGVPIAFWQGLAYDGVFFVGSTGYDPRYRDQRVGTYLLMRVIEELCGDPSVSAIDYGPGDAAYKRQFGSESWDEQDVAIFAPTIRAIRINILRTGILGTARGAKRTLAAIGVADTFKKRWRRRLSNPNS
jgi:hypothetical protein